MNNTALVKRNIITTILLQIVTILSGFVLPKLILSHFGSEVNGLTSSITQFLNYIQLLEGGLTGVIMAALYKPLADKDIEKVSSIIKATESFFRKIGVLYVVYALLLAVVYPLIVKTRFSYIYVSTLVLIIGISSFIQYFFSLTFRILLTADRRGYIVSIANILFLLLNLGITIVAFRIYPEIHIIKFINAVSFTVQPIIFSTYVKRHYSIDKYAPADKKALNQRWDGFGQNLAFFIHSNTDIVILTFFSLGQVSVYAVYAMIVSAIKNLINSISSAIEPSMGNVLVSQTEENRNRVFDGFEFVISIITTTMFTCCIVLIVPFVKVYTTNINDANYIQPLFAALLCVAEAVYCLRTPYISVAYSSGHFKETAKYAYIEAGLNIIISLILVPHFGLVGEAIGTVISMLFRLIAHIVYLKKNILFRPISKAIKNIMPFIISCTASILTIKYLVNVDVNGYFSWFVFAIIVGVIVVIFQLICLLLFRRNMLFTFIKTYVLRKRA